MDIIFKDCLVADSEAKATRVTEEPKISREELKALEKELLGDA